MFTMSVADMLDEYFEHEAIKGSIASTGVSVSGPDRHPRHRLQPPPPRARELNGKQRLLGGT